mmetsp:Transcript_73940/g.208740  ORF Transcript_73940/g.208740 Transcript_73940/m.208740 type:complete len:240 (+) Transcript_73940:551-1270(+)
MRAVHAIEAVPLGAPGAELALVDAALASRAVLHAVPLIDLGAPGALHALVVATLRVRPGHVPVPPRSVARPVPAVAVPHVGALVVALEVTGGAGVVAGLGLLEPGADVLGFLGEAVRVRLELRLEPPQRERRAGLPAGGVAGAAPVAGQDGRGLAAGLNQCLPRVHAAHVARHVRPARIVAHECPVHGAAHLLAAAQAPLRAIKGRHQGLKALLRPRVGFGATHQRQEDGGTERHDSTT